MLNNENLQIKLIYLKIRCKKDEQWHATKDL